MIDPETILAWKTNYGLDTRSPEKAAAWWHEKMAGKAPAGAVAALGLALEEIDRLRDELERCREMCKRDAV